ncbi:hypothetical protein CN169_00640 [Sinorhizobium meliloti]|nr:hypothetical protein CN169_00640 [Sinorhizobium meliloti]
MEGRQPSDGQDQPTLLYDDQDEELRRRGKIVDAIRRGDGEAAYKAALELVANASAIAEAVLSGQRE